MANRYDGVMEAINEEEMYAGHRERRGVKTITQFKTFSMTHPTVEQIGTLQLVGHMWKLGDRYYKLAYEHYGDSQWWWVIAWYNQLPTESHVELGQVIDIPFPLHQVLSYMRGS